VDNLKKQINNQKNKEHHRKEKLQAESIMSKEEETAV
jgi:hypothetical protein